LDLGGQRHGDRAFADQFEDLLHDLVLTWHDSLR